MEPGVKIIAAGLYLATKEIPLFDLNKLHLYVEADWDSRALAGYDSIAQFLTRRQGDIRLADTAVKEAFAGVMDRRRAEEES